jgi:hypothetical protein
MVQGCGLSLEFESAQTVGLTRPVCRKDFDGDLTFQRQIAGTIPLTPSRPSIDLIRPAAISLQGRKAAVIVV